MKKQYENVEAEVLELSTDVITSSDELPFDSTEQKFSW